MGSLIEEEEFRFFDARSEIASCSNTSSGRIEYDESPSSIPGLSSSISNDLQYDVWIKSPGNTEERREKFLNWMGVSLNQTFHHEHSSKSSNVDHFPSSIRVFEGDNSRKTVLRSSKLDDEFSSCRCDSSMLGLSDNVDRIVKESDEIGGKSNEIALSNLGFSDEISFKSPEDRIVKERDEIGDKIANLGFSDEISSESPEDRRIVKESDEIVPSNLGFSDEISYSVCSESPIVKENTEITELKSQNTKLQGDLGGIMKRVKEKWLNRLNKVRNRQRSVVSGEVSVFGGRIERVKVKECKKEVKELSGLFRGQEIQAHEGSILAMKFSPNGRYLASGGEDKVLRVWSIVEDERSEEQDVPKIDPSCIYFEVSKLSELKPVAVEKDNITGSLMSPRRRMESACVIIPPKIFRVLERPVHEFRGHTGDILDISWSKNNRLLSASVDNTVRLWQVGLQDCLGIFSHSNYVTSVQFNPVNEDYFISGSIDGKIRIWSVSQCQVVDWADARGIVTAVCYRPDGQAAIVGTLTSECRFYKVCGHHLQVDGHMCLHSNKKSSNKRIIGFQFDSNDQSRVMVASADSQVRILSGRNVVQKYKGSRNTGNQISASFTCDGKHIISACDDSSIYIWNCILHGNSNNHPEPSSTFFSNTKRLKIRSFEKFSADVSVAIPWCGFGPTISGELSPSLFSLGREYVLDSPKGSATWPEEKLGTSFSPVKAIRRSHYRFLRSSCQRTSEDSHLWGLVIVTGGWDGRIRLFHNYGLPVPV